VELSQQGIENVCPPVPEDDGYQQQTIRNGKFKLQPKQTEAMVNIDCGRLEKRKMIKCLF
jgi:hypothetical protein